MKARIIIKYLNNNFELGNYVFNENDGSFYVSLTRQGLSRKTWNFATNLQSLEQSPVIELNEAVSKTTKISYHSSGRINFQKDRQNRHIIYAEPITRVRQVFPIFLYSIPTVKKLTITDDNLRKNDIVIELPSSLSNQRINFTFLISPCNACLNNKIPVVSVSHESLFALSIVVENNSFAIPDKLKKTFMLGKLTSGLYAGQLISTDQAIIDYQHFVTKSNDIVRYSPNREGIYKLFYSVPMRVAPQISIEFFDNELKYEIYGDIHTSSHAYFKVYREVDGNKHYVKSEVPIKSIILDSEL